MHTYAVRLLSNMFAGQCSSRLYSTLLRAMSCFADVRIQSVEGEFDAHLFTRWNLNLGSALGVLGGVQFPQGHE